MLAYYDSFAGLVPCKITDTAPLCGSDPYAQVSIHVTATRGAWKRGNDTIVPRNRIVPRTAVFVRGGQYRIRFYCWNSIMAGSPARIWG